MGGSISVPPLPRISVSPSPKTRAWLIAPEAARIMTHSPPGAFRRRDKCPTAWKIAPPPKITEGLMRKDYRDDDIRKILGGNLLGVMEQTEKVSKEMHLQQQ